MARWLLVCLLFVVTPVSAQWSIEESQNTDVLRVQADRYRRRSRERRGVACLGVYVHPNRVRLYRNP